MKEKLKLYRAWIINTEGGENQNVWEALVLACDEKKVEEVVRKFNAGSPKSPPIVLPIFILIEKVEQKSGILSAGFTGKRIPRELLSNDMQVLFTERVKRP